MQTVRKLFNDWRLIHSGTGKSLGREGGGRRLAAGWLNAGGRKKEKPSPEKKKRKNIVKKDEKKKKEMKEEKKYTYLYYIYLCTRDRKRYTRTRKASFRSRCLPGIVLFIFFFFVLHIFFSSSENSCTLFPPTYIWDFVLFAMFRKETGHV
jgi:hypothetical protein